MIGLMADAGDNFKKRATIPLAPCTIAMIKCMHPSGNRIKVSDERIKVSDNRIKVSDNRIKVSDIRIKASDKRIKVSDNRIKVSDNRIKVSDNRIKVSVNRIKVRHNRIKITPLLVLLDFDSLMLEEEVRPVHGQLDVSRHVADQLIDGEKEDEQQVL
jgi:hypothetical protein